MLLPIGFLRLLYATQLMTNVLGLSEQEPLDSTRHKLKYKNACPAYTNYAATKQ